MAWRFVPAHVNESTEPVDNLGGVLSARPHRRARSSRSTSCRSPTRGRSRSAWRSIAVAARVAFVIRQRRAPNPLYDLRIAGRRVFWVAACAGIIVFGSLMGAMFIGQQYLQNVLGYSTLEAGAGDPPGRRCAWSSSRRGRPSSSRRAARGSPCSSATSSCLLGFVTMLLLWTEGSPYWSVGLGYALVGVGVGFAGHAGVALADRLRAGPAGRHGVGDRGPAARPGRRADAVDLRRAAHGRLRGRGRGRASPAPPTPTRSSASVAGPATSSSYGAPRPSPPSTRSTPTPSPRRRRPSFLAGDRVGLPRRDHRVLLGAALVFLVLPEAGEERRLLAEYHAADVDGGAAVAEPVAVSRRHGR